MPSFCIIDSCKRVKQVGDTVSFHKFPTGTEEIYQKWLEFVAQTSKDKARPKKITKFSSICSQHFLDSDFSGNGTNTRRFLRKHAVPSISSSNSQLETAPVQIILEDETPLSTIHSILCGSCCVCRTASTFVLELDEYYFSIMRKCLPFINFNLSLMQQRLVCNDCVSILNTFSSFIDRIVVAQNMAIKHPQINDSISRNIKIEPLPFEEDQAPRNSIIPREVITKGPARASTSQKKCEILEIVDIKQPLNFLPFQTNALATTTNALASSSDLSESIVNHEAATFEPQTADVQILSPNQLKVEINDLDDDEGCNGENELELIKNFVYINSIYNHDHNYVREQGDENNVKVELDEELHPSYESTAVSLKASHRDTKVCCNKKFSTFRKYLKHKFMKHQKITGLHKQNCGVCKQKFVTTKSFETHKRFYCKKLKKANASVYKIVKNTHTPPVVVKSLVNDVEIFKGKKSDTKKRMIRSSQLPPADEQNQCPICFKVFKAPKNLYQHKSSTHSEAKYVCVICNKSFKMKHGLKQHIVAQHEKRKIYTCNICGHNYALKGDLKRCRHSDLKKKA